MKSRKCWIISLSVIFLILTILVVCNLVSDFDTLCYHFIAYKVSENNFLTPIYKGLTFLGSTFFIILISCFFFILFLILKKRNYSFIIAITIIISTVVNNVVKLIIRRKRPTVLALVMEDTFSFPSGHTMASATIYGLLSYLVIRCNWPKKVKIPLSIILGLMPILVGFSRIYLGAHFATDIIGALLMSTIILLIITNYIDKKNLL